jgi:phosphatidate phosphatase APP1
MVCEPREPEPARQGSERPLQFRSGSMNHQQPTATPPRRERIAILALRLLRLVLRVVTLPWRLVRKLRRRPLRITAFRGYGSAGEVVVRGRLVDTAPIARAGKRGRLRRLRTLFRRLSTPPVPSARVEVSIRGSRAETTTGSDGMFTIRVRKLWLEPRGQWQPIEINADAGKGRTTRAQSEALIPSDQARFGIISDIDDTVVYTGVANRLSMMWRLFASDAESRVAFEGAGALYRALHRGTAERGHNPIFYVSRGPWSIYPVLEEFFRRHRIPIGPILLLRDWGVHLGHPWPRRARDHKRQLIDELLTMYPELPFIMVGDSGQHDPEIYLDAVERWGSRIVCSYIRDVTDDLERAGEIARLARQAERLGSEMVLAADTRTMAEHAAERGFIAPDDVATVCRQADRDRQAPTESRREVRLAP